MSTRFLFAFFIGVGATAMPATAAQLRLDTQLGQGYDSNAMRLSSAVGTRSGAFTDLSGTLDLDHKFDSTWFGGADLALGVRQYYGDARDASERNYAARANGGLHFSSLVPNRRATLRAELGYRVRDTTYVSPSTGEVATSGGESIGDRYDAGAGELGATATVPLLEGVDATLRGALQRRDYRNDYDALDLEPLDYTQFTIEPGLRWKDAQQRVRVELPLEWRRFRDRRARDQAGNYLDGTDLAYRYAGIDAKYERAVTEAVSLETSFRYQDLRDDEGGYYDRSRWSVSVGGGYDLDPQTRLTADVAFMTLHYSRVAAGDEDINEEQPDGRSWSAGMSYATVLPIWNLGAYAQLRWSRSDSPTARYDYDRWQVSAGVRKRFGLWRSGRN